MTNGNLLTSNYRLRTIIPIKLMPGTYTISYSGIVTQVSIYFWDLENNYIPDLWLDWTTGDKTFTIEHECYVKFAFKKSDTDILNLDSINNIQLEQNSEATDYEAYIKPTIYTLNENNIYEEFKQAEKIIAKRVTDFFTPADGFSLMENYVYKQGNHYSGYILVKKDSGTFGVTSVAIGEISIKPSYALNIFGIGANDQWNAKGIVYAYIGLNKTILVGDSYSIGCNFIKIPIDMYINQD